jgi:cytochrome d ubiquinol oxidase subunit II
MLVALAWFFFSALRRGREIVPFLCALGFFFLAYVGLGISMWPMMVPPSVSFEAAAAPPASQAFLLWGASVLIPVILIYTGYVYWLFRGKVQIGVGYH